MRLLIFKGFLWCFMPFSLSVHAQNWPPVGTYSLLGGVRTNGEYHFTLNGGEARADYVVESSTNLVNWFPLVTNNNFGSSWAITASASGEANYYRVRREAISLFAYGLATRGNLQLNGNGIVINSWNSHDTNQSYNGYYSGFVGTNGDVGSFQGIVNIGQHIINGSLYLGSNAAYTGNPAQVTGHIYTDANLTFQDVSLPTQDENGQNLPLTWLLAPITSFTTNKITTYSHTFISSGYYTIYDSYPIAVNAGVNVMLDVRTANWNPISLTINGGTTNSGNLVLYLRSGDITLNGNSSGGATGNRPENYFIFALPGVSSITLNSAGVFVGAIYAPEAALIVNGAGNDINILGAAVVNTMTLNGHYNFHYDTSLGAFYTR